MKLEFEDGVLTVLEYFSEETEFIRARINNLCKLMAKKAKVKFVDVINMPIKDWFENYTEFQKKYGLEQKFDFLVK